MTRASSMESKAKPKKKVNTVAVAVSVAVLVIIVAATVVVIVVSTKKKGEGSGWRCSDSRVCVSSKPCTVGEIGCFETRDACILSRACTSAGVCCEEGTCKEQQSQGDCTTDNWNNRTSSCKGNPCGIKKVAGICCADNGMCKEQRSKDGCPDNQWNDQLKSCANNPCASGVCCDDNRCEPQPSRSSECKNWRSETSTCTENPCNLVTGVCCDNYQCNPQISKGKCGNWLKGELSCADNPCGFKPGVCCDNNQCVPQTSRGNCQRWNDVVTTCDTDTCTGSVHTLPINAVIQGVVQKTFSGASAFQDAQKDCLAAERTDCQGINSTADSASTIASVAEGDKTWPGANALELGQDGQFASVIPSSSGQFITKISVGDNYKLIGDEYGTKTFTCNFQSPSCWQTVNAYCLDDPDAEGYNIEFTGYSSPATVKLVKNIVAQKQNVSSNMAFSFFRWG